MKKRILTILIFFAPFLCKAQIDSSYIRPFDHKFAIQPYVSMSLFLMNHEEFGTGKDKSYAPNTPPSIGVGLSINNTIIDFSYGYKFDFMADKELGKTESFDFQIHNYRKKLVLDLFIQKYQGFYNEELDEPIELFPDLIISKFGLYGQYVFNYKHYSYKAAFVKNEKQLKSAGSFLIGGGIFKTKIESDSSFFHNGKNALDNFQFGVSAGYTYTWVFGEYWDISTSTTVGINFGSEKIRRFGRSKVELSPTVFPRISVGYNRESWSLGFSFVGNMTSPLMSKDSAITLFTGGFQFSFLKRFNVIPFLKKKPK